LGKKLIRLKGPVQHSIELTESLAHLLFDPFDGQAGLLRNFGVGHAVDPVRHKYLPRLWTQAHHSRVKSPEHISGFEKPVLIETRQRQFIGDDMQGGRMSEGNLCPVLQEIDRYPAKIGLRPLKRQRPPIAHPCEPEEYILDKVTGVIAVARLS
jgi:hypothetical protein